MISDSDESKKVQELELQNSAWLFGEGSLNDLTRPLILSQG